MIDHTLLAPEATAAGATRIGASSTAVILDGLPAT
jgi:deoxyribose-phosphate aldolase